VQSCFAQQTDVARAFDRSVRTIRRYQQRYVADDALISFCPQAAARIDDDGIGRRRDAIFLSTERGYPPASVGAAAMLVGRSCAELERTCLGSQAAAKFSSCIKNFRLGSRKPDRY